MSKQDGGGVKFAYVPKFTLGLGNSSNQHTPAPAASLIEFRNLGKEELQDGSTVDMPGIQVIKTQVAVPADISIATPQPSIPADNSTQQEEQTEDVIILEPPVEVEEAQADQEVLGEFIEVPDETAGPQKQQSIQGAPQPANGEYSQQYIAELGRRPYWMRTCKHISSPFLRLHQEIVELTELLQPTPDEVAARQTAVAVVTEAVQSIWPLATVHVFGSFATGLYVPTSDVDLVVMNSKCTDLQTGLKALAAALMRKQVAKNVQVVGKAKVPIVKFETAEFGGLAFDISFDVANGPQAADLVRDFVGTWPMMRPLVLILKLFLQQRELNEVYTGGIGSYALITMVAASLQLHTSRKPKTSSTPRRGSGAETANLLEPSLGVLLVDFFRLYGRMLNVNQIGVSAVGGARFFNKDDKSPSWVNRERPFMLAVEDPKDETNDVCRNSYNIRLVKASFDFAYQQLIAPCAPDESLLARILRLGAILISRKPPTDRIKLYTQPVPVAVSVPVDSCTEISNGKSRDVSEGKRSTGSRDRSEKRSHSHTPERDSRDREQKRRKT